MNILLIGPGKSRHRMGGGLEFGKSKGEYLSIADYSQSALDYWRDAEYKYKVDLNHPPFPFPAAYFDQVHAYEILNLLPGNADSFFMFWRAIWETMRPSAMLYASVPYWQSEYIHSYPGPQRVYTLPLLMYLDRDAQATAKEDFPLWCKPYNFHLHAWRTFGTQPDGLYFALEKA